MFGQCFGLPRRFYLGSGLFFIGLLVIGCTPYPVYNPTHTVPPDDARLSGETVPEDFEPATRPNESRRNWKGSGTTIDPTLLRRVVETYVGTPYRRGGDNLRGIDCSNLVHAIYRDYDGTDIPDDTRRLYRLPDAIVESDLQVGDLVFFNFANTRSPSHVGVYLGNNEFVHASETAGVIISTLDDGIYRDAYSGARRVVARLHTGE